MRVQWYGQSAFSLATAETTVFIDPFAEMSAAAAARGMQFDYPAIEGIDAHVLLVTHEHMDHNGIEAIGGDPHVLRSTAGKHDSTLGEVIGVASEHDQVAGTERGPNTIFVFDFDGVRVGHFGDFGQARLRPEQLEAIGPVDLLFIPVGAGPTIGPPEAKEIATQLHARWIVPMHYRTPRIGFLEPADAFLDLYEKVERLATPAFDTADLPTEGPVVVVPAVP